MVSQVTALAPNDDWSGIRADLDVGLSSSEDVRPVDALATMRDQLRGSLILAVTTGPNDKLGVDQEHIFGPLAFPCGPKSFSRR